MSLIADHLQAVRQRIDRAAQACGRDPAAVTLMAVSKTFDADAVQAAIDAGHTVFGESYVQEAIAKMDALQAARGPLAWHFIGPLQSNKARQVAEHMDWVHSIDRLKIAQRLSDLRPEGLAPLQVCLQVNLDNEATKSGVAPHDVLPLAQAVHGLPRLHLRGLMSIPAPSDDPAVQRAAFARLAALQQQLQDAGLPVDTLSMGMSDDLEAAVAEGATIVRVGTAIFGNRAYA
jgi:pyridoxal phosphate enzyme (YggS family)